MTITSAMQRDDRRVQRGADQLGTQRLALLEVVGEAFEHAAERAALFAGCDHRAVDVVELARCAGQRARERRAGVDLGCAGARPARAGAGLRPRRPSAVSARSSGRPAPTSPASWRVHTARPVVLKTRRVNRTRARSRQRGGHRVDADRHQRLARAAASARPWRCRPRASRCATCLGVEGFEAVGRHLSRWRPLEPHRGPGPSCRIGRVTRNTSSSDVMPSSTRRSPSSRIERMPAPLGGDEEVRPPRRGCGSASAACRRRSSARRRRCGPCSRCCRQCSQPTGCQRPSCVALGGSARTACAPAAAPARRAATS